MGLRDILIKLRYKYLPDHAVGELLEKRWIDNIIPFLALTFVLIISGITIPNFFGADNISDTLRQLGEFGFVVLALLIVIVAGGIDLTVGSTFALTNFLAIYLTYVAEWSNALIILTVVASGALVGLVNGILIGFFKLRAFLTTLVTLIIVRSLVDILQLKHGVSMATSMVDAPLFDLIGMGTFLTLPISFWALLVFGFLGHIFLSRMGAGWQIMAVGGSRRSAYNAGLPVRRIVCSTYVISGALCGIAGYLFSARLGSAGSDTGVGLEIMALTAAIVGGISLGGGRGSVAKAIMGASVVLLVTNGLIRMGYASGASKLALGVILISAILIDIRWTKNKQKLLNQTYVSPALMDLPPAPDASEGSGSVYAVNDKLRDVTLIGLEQLEGAEDVVFDRNDYLYTGNRYGDIVRFAPPHYDTHEVFAHVGGHPLGLTMDADDNLVCCVAGMGLYRISPDRRVENLTDETNRSWMSIIDDSRLKLADDLDIAPNGDIYFSEATTRYEMYNWAYDALESRGNGRIICYSPSEGTTRTVIRNLVFPNGVCMTRDGESFLFAESWGCRISRYWFAGPKAGKLEYVIQDLPGYPDNINRSSDGNYWIALMGMRTPSMDLALKMPGFRKRMARRVSPDDLIFPNLNTGCVIKVDVNGNVLEALWDRQGENHPMITSMREHKGNLYLGGLLNNRIGKIALPDADPSWTASNDYWGVARGLA